MRVKCRNVYGESELKPLTVTYIRFSLALTDTLMVKLYFFLLNFDVAWEISERDSLPQNASSIFCNLFVKLNFGYFYTKK